MPGGDNVDGAAAANGDAPLPGSAEKFAKASLGFKAAGFNCLDLQHRGQRR